MKKIIQIAVSETSYNYPFVVALDDEGNIWQHHPQITGWKWYKLPPVTDKV